MHTKVNTKAVQNIQLRLMEEIHKSEAKSNDAETAYCRTVYVNTVNILRNNLGTKAPCAEVDIALWLKFLQQHKEVYSTDDMPSTTKWTYSLVNMWLDVRQLSAQSPTNN